MADAYATSGELLRAFRDGHTTPRAHLDLLRERIERLDGRLHAFVTVYGEDAQAAADAAGDAFRRGYPTGPLQGVPFALKDIVDVAGHETRGGSKAFVGRVPERSATIAERLLGAGGVLLGKTHTVEVAMGGWGTNQRFGTPLNPWDMATHRTPGGSSSGSGVAVAAGLVPFAIGTDTGGSVRLPAAWNGIVGLKVTEAVLPLDGIIPLSHTLDTPGPMARSVEDCALGFEILRGFEPRRVLDHLLQDRGIFAGLRRGVVGLVVGAMPEVEREEVDPEVLAAYDASLETLAARGATVRVLALPQRFDEYKERTGVIIAAEGFFHHGKLFGDPDAPLDEDVRPRILAGRDLTAQAYLDAIRGRIDDQAAFLRAIEGVDVLLTPTIATAALPVDRIDQKSTPAGFTRFGNYLGLCGVSVPNGMTRDGLPTSLQILGRGHAEPLVLRVAAEIERAAGGRFPSPDLPS
jgi:aspartyl-tRNA(Asn)/glutamyl-tRNA(Gln) amidotransferase subunit A